MKAFDIDGTLLDYGAAPGADPIINESLIATLNKGERIALVTNQGGLAYNLTGESAKFPGPIDFVRRLAQLIDYLTDRGIAVDNIHACTYSPRLGEHPSWQASKAVRNQVPFYISDSLFLHHTLEWRKPGPAMLTASKATVYYGDSDEDEEAAAAAGIPFVHVERFASGGGGNPVNLTSCQRCGRPDKVIISDSERWCPVCGTSRSYYLAADDLRPPFNSQLWFVHEPLYDYGDEAEMVADWAREMAPDTIWGASRVWVLDHLDDDAAARCYDVRVESVPTWFAYRVDPEYKPERQGF